MKVCILGSGLTTLTTAKALINQGIYVDILFESKKKNENKTRTLGISKSSIEFFNKDILNIEKFLWDILKIEIFSENLGDEKVLNFEDKNKRLFSIIKNYELSNYLLRELKKSKLFKIKKKIINHNTIQNNYKLIINCDLNNQITKNYFFKKINKNYRSNAYTAIISHKKMSTNNIATQIFTKRGPIAFLPISEDQTSIVYSVRDGKNFEFKKIIERYNTKYEIKKISESISFNLKSSVLRSYQYKNILAFGDLLHRIHPLAGQGFNMTIRDIKVLVNLIKFKINHGLDLDNSICMDFEKLTRHKNYIFANGIDLIYEFFNFESKYDNKAFSKLVQLIGKNNTTNKVFKKIADIGIPI
tara:strand:+ start:4629 stop:5702 length:1074 start_codon:yes stop_codon:yes gene_type:complete